MIKIKVAPDLGYCMGVARAIEKAKEYGKKHGEVYSLGPVAHNEEVVELLRKHGVIPISPECRTIGTPDGFKLIKDDPVIITAHGAPPETYKRISDLHLACQDCTCPIVNKSQEEVARLHSAGFDIVIFGDPEHQEVKGLVGWGKERVKFVGTFNQLFTPGQGIKPLGLGKNVGVVSQTTQVPPMYADFVTTLMQQHINEFKEVTVLNTICPYVVQRIEESRKLARETDFMLIIGSKESANTANLFMVCLQEMGGRLNWRVNLIQNEEQLSEVVLAHLELVLQDVVSPKIGITAGTSTPIEVVEKVIAKLEELGGKCEQH